MNPARQSALEYFRAPLHGPWNWAEDGGVLVWQDGTTIAFRQEILQILEWLAPRGWPPFGSLVFLLAACRGKLPAISDFLRESDVPATSGKAKSFILTANKRQLLAQIQESLDQLDRLSAFPAELLSGLKSKCVLAEAVFETSTVERHVQTRSVLKGFQEPMSDSELIEAPPGALGPRLVRQLHLVAHGLKFHTTDSLSLRLQTGLDTLPNEVPLELPTAECARRLIDEISRDSEFGAVARAARELMAAVRLPRRLVSHEEMPIGGVSDISNRGPLDRLLLSELAHDDLTLSVRIALNEALYLRREPPQREPPGTMALLLDSGLRLWGIPRILGTAVALALIACEKHHSKILVCRSRARQAIPIDLLSRKGLSDHLSNLELDVHPGESLAAFLAETSTAPDTQSVLITHADVLKDAEFRRNLAELPAPPGFIATVDRVGRFELHLLPLTPARPICQAQLDIESVLGKEQALVPLVNREFSPDLPAIFGVSPFPFLLPLNGRVHYWTRSEDGSTFAALGDRRLVNFRDYRAGGRILASDLPPGGFMWMECVDNVVHMVKAGAGERPPRLLSQPLDGGPLRSTVLATGPELQTVQRYGDVIVLVRTHDTRAYSLSDGHLMGQALNPYRAIHGRYWMGKKDVHFPVWDGERIKFEPVTLPNFIQREEIALVFDREGFEGPWVVLRKGVVISTTSGEKIDLGGARSLGIDFSRLRVSRDGHRLFVAAFHSHSGYLWNLREKKFFDLSKIPPPELDPSPALPNWNIFRVVESVAVAPEGLVFSGRKGRWRKLILHGSSHLCIQTEGTNRSRIVGFSEPRKTKYGCFLQTATWPSGSQAMLDSRGLLHLKSHFRNMPELSLILADGEVAGWTSDGYVCGPPFFFEQPYVSEPGKVFERLQHFLQSV